MERKQGIGLGSSVWLPAPVSVVGLVLANDQPSGGPTFFIAGCGSFPAYFQKASAPIRIVRVLKPQIPGPHLSAKDARFVMH